MAWRRMSQRMLRITIEQSAKATLIILEGRITGSWTAELGRTWAELAPTMGTRKLSIDLRNTTYADASGIQALKDIYLQTAAELVTSSPWTEYLAEKIKR
jgi:anti-anti-sigma regulatory factor